MDSTHMPLLWMAFLTLIGVGMPLSACDDNTSKKAESPDGRSTSQSSNASSSSGDTASGESGAGRREDDKSSDDMEGRPEAISGQSGTVPEEPPLEIDSYLTPKAMSEMASGTYEATQLPGRKPSPDYNARRLRPAEGDGYGAGLQVWAFEASDRTQSMFDKLRSQYLNTRELPDAEAGELRGRAFLSERGSIRNLVMRLEQPPRVVALSCSKRTCASIEALIQMATHVETRIRQRASGDDAKGDAEQGGQEGTDSSEESPARDNSNTESSDETPDEESSSNSE